MTSGIVDDVYDQDGEPDRVRPEEQAVWVERGPRERFPDVRQAVAADRPTLVHAVYEEPDGTWRALLTYTWDDHLGWHVETFGNC